MVKNSIKVYGRIKPILSKTSTEEYDIHSTVDGSEILTFKLPSNNRTENPSFRFQKVFDRTSNQEELFNVIAKPVVDSVLQGYNGTIFAYGQTGSGKTYSMTGGLSSVYDDRGIVPRTIQHIFDESSKDDTIHTIYISYLEIYNECGYDLLNPGHKVSRLDDLPRVSLLEDTNGILHLKNLSLHAISNKEEALDLLFLGDTNRMISETPMNPMSSRSHSVFTVHIQSCSSKSSTFRRSKLHLIDLAGSERVSKTGIDGNLLVEARHINLSLHFLEQVIVALGDPRRIHVPYRNSMMTTVLRDSLGGNCMTAMLATLSANSSNIDRVAMVRNEVRPNEERDPKQEIILLRADVRRLKEQIALLTAGEITDELTSTEKEECETWVREYMQNKSEIVPPSDPRKVNLCFSMLRDAVTTPDKVKVEQGLEGLVMARKSHQDQVAEQVERFRGIISQRDSEIFIDLAILVNLLRKEKQKANCKDILQSDSSSLVTTSTPTLSVITSEPSSSIESEAIAKDGSIFDPCAIPGTESDRSGSIFISSSVDNTNVSSDITLATVPSDCSTQTGSSKSTRANTSKDFNSHENALNSSEYETGIQPLTTDQIITLTEQEAFKLYAADRNHRVEVDRAKAEQRKKYNEAKAIAAQIENSKKQMVDLHSELKQLLNLATERDGNQQNRVSELRTELEMQQKTYRQALMDLQFLKVETTHQKHAVEQAKLRLLRNFHEWWAEQRGCSKPDDKTHSCEDTCIQLRKLSRPHSSHASSHQIQPDLSTDRPRSAGPILHQLLQDNLSVFSEETSHLPQADDVDLEQCFSNDAVSGTSDPCLLSEDKPTDEVSTSEIKICDSNDIQNSIPLTGDPELDTEIIDFYKARNKMYYS